MHAEYAPLVTEITPFLKGFTLFFWITGTWWIPLLFILAIWRHFIHHYPLSYDPQFWGMAFPLAMYTTGTLQLSHALGVDYLTIIPKVMAVVAFGGWLIGFIGLILHIITTIKEYIQRAPS
ncbi:hypothetical protein P5G51_019670 [Virgibacillus sp. 179-BFC.A HS]|uniref:C4-dicarboxylate ABC transporter n=1 Tax=Tigheibacillus jepli TaxID=3035914 RepID=A0ABU5CLL5_9BACI|nr:hypothetical protein [Virgibacillus sp. 179-BFC.A HS]MDY0407253.1 hypothetical protein [Virgibacillus sp. 179-BFC.A HS]